jgi:hypothetical protein
MAQYSAAADAPVRLWMLDGAGHALHALLCCLTAEKGWSDGDLDTRLEVTLVDSTRTLGEFQEWAIPCARVLVGDVGGLIKRAAAASLPHVLCLHRPVVAMRVCAEGTAQQGTASVRCWGRERSELPAAAALASFAGAGVLAPWIEDAFSGHGRSLQAVGGDDAATYVVCRAPESALEVVS